MSRARALLPLLAAVLPAVAVAEGNRLVIACETLAPDGDAPGTTDAAGADALYAAAPERPTFTLAPVGTGADGAGPVAVTGPDGLTTEGVTAGFAGPYAWSEGSVLNTLTVEGTTQDGRAQVLWHRLDQSQSAVPPVGHLTKLICEVS